MNSLLGIMNDLEGICQNTGLENIGLSRIVAIGLQGSGKSSVLEGCLVHRSILPRGHGIMTRCPIILQLHKLPNSNDEEYYEILVDTDGKKAERFKDPQEVQHCLKLQPKKLLGGVSTYPIVVRVYSPTVYSQTIVDLPGLVEIDDQPNDIVKMLEDLTMEYIKAKDSIILAVCAGDVDIATSHTLKLAEKVDPNGDRTIVVLTKLDKLNPSQTRSALEVLQGKKIVNESGIVGVINSSQQDVFRYRPTEEVQREEVERLQRDYPSLEGKFGSAYLAKRLNQILLENLKKCIPSLKNQILGMYDLKMHTKELLGEPMPTSDFEQIALMSDIIRKFEVNYKKMIEKRSKIDVTLASASPGVKISTATSKFCTNIKETATFSEIKDEDFVTLVQQNGNLENFTSFDDIFKALVEMEVYKFEPLCQEYADSLHSILESTIDECLEDFRCVKLNTEISSLMKKILSKNLGILKRRILCKMLLERLSIVHTTDENFNRLLIDPTRRGYNQANKPPTDTFGFPVFKHPGGFHPEQTKVFKELVSSYLKATKTAIMDSWPGRAIYKLYFGTMTEFHDTMIQSCKETYKNLMVEPDSITVKRSHLDAELQTLSEATNVLCRIQSGHIAEIVN